MQGYRRHEREGGRPRVIGEEKRKIMQALRNDPMQNIGAICKTMGIPYVSE